jgi:hypothetical protein
MHLPPAFNQALPLHQYTSNTLIFNIPVTVHNKHITAPRTNVARQAVSKKSDKSALYVGLGVKQKH